MSHLWESTQYGASSSLAWNTTISGFRAWPVYLLEVHPQGLLPIAFHFSGLGLFGSLNFLTDSHHLGMLFPQKPLVFLFGTLDDRGGILGCVMVLTLPWWDALNCLSCISSIPSLRATFSKAIHPLDQAEKKSLKIRNSDETCFPGTHMVPVLCLFSTHPPMPGGGRGSAHD